MAQVSEFKIGDIVRITLGEPDKPGCEIYVREVTHSVMCPSEIALGAVRTYEENNWTVELIERPAPPLPTKPNTFGWAEYEGERHIVRRGARGQWELYDEDGYFELAAHKSAISDFTEAVLIPKALADRVTAWVYDDTKESLSSLMTEIAEHLKGQDDE